MIWLGRHELGLLICLAIVSAGVWAFAELADEVMAGETEALDTRILMLMRNPDDPTDPIGAHWLEEVGRDVTALGGVAVLSGLTLFVAGYMALQQRFRAMAFMLVTVGGGLLLSLVLKGWFDRPRPDLVSHESFVYTTSFPSGHSTLAAVAYLTLGVMLARIHAQRRLKAYFLLIAGAVTLAVGVSRVYMGVHWPTDVLAGWAIGAVWAVLCSALASRLQRRHQIEPELESGEEAAESVE